MGEKREVNIGSTSEEEDTPKKSSSKESVWKSVAEGVIGLRKGNYQSKSDENGKGQLLKEEVEERIKEMGREREALALAKECLANEEGVYNLYKKRENTFQAEIQPLISVFHGIMDELIFFAGCQTEANYEGRKTILLNKQELLRDGIQNRMRGQGISFEGIDRMKQTLKEIESCHVDRNTTATGKQERKGLKKADVEEETKKYINENQKLRMDEIRQRQCLEYACLLKAFYPIVEEICGRETMDAQWAGEIAERLEKVVENQRCIFSDNMKFCWVYPDDDVVKQSEQLQLQFRAAEVDCPGLYYRDSSRQDQYVCVVPGCVK